MPGPRDYDDEEKDGEEVPAPIEEDEENSIVIEYGGKDQEGTIWPIPPTIDLGGGD